jgi:beta-lactamase class A
MKPVYYIKWQHKPKRKLFNTFFILGLSLIATYFITTSLITKPALAPNNVLGEQDILLTENITPSPMPSSIPTVTISPSTSLGQVVQDALIGTRGSYGIVIKNLKTGENYSLNEDEKYYSASLYKLWVMAETYRQIKNGILKESEILTEKYEALDKTFNVNSEAAKPKEGTISLSIKDALNKMITISDNYAAFLLTQKIRLKNVASFIKINGFNESMIGTNENPPTTTASDIASFFEKLYKKQFIDDEYSDKMLELLKWQKLNDKLPKYLPDNTIVAHKTGELNEYTHDAGIVYMQNADYIIVVLSKSEDPALAKNRISNVSESVYNYFNQEQATPTP